MDIHKPKPVHGWREFLGEIGVIVIGVLIALTGEQTVEALHWRHQVKSAREALADDFEDVVREASEREVLSACIGSRLDFLSALVDDAGQSGRLPALGTLGNPTNRPWQINSWNGLIASQVATHLPRPQLLSISRISNGMAEIARLNGDEIDQWSVLYTLVGPGRIVEPGEIPAIRRALVQARLDAKYLRLEARQMRNEITNGELLPANRDAVAAREAAAAATSQNSLCQALGPAPAHYGVAAPARVQLSGPLQEFPLGPRGLPAEQALHRREPKSP